MQDKILISCETCAIGFLSRREHSQFELRQKLQTKGYDAVIVAEVLQKLEKNRLQSDERFASCYTRSRMERGCGPIRIQYELQNRGIAAEISAQVIEEHKDDWLELAKKVRVKKFGSKPPASFADKVKQERFLLYKGFTKQLLMVDD